MKKYIIYLIALPVALASCVGTEDDLFDKSAAERINESTIKYDSLLRSATNGWLVEYYPEASMAYGGYNLYFRFGANETVAVGSEDYGDKLAESLYSMKSDMGPTLNFDTYNEALHYYCDPGLAVGGGAGLGYEGDYEFAIVSGSESEINMKGKKTGNTIRMTPLPDAMTWEQYNEKINEIKEFGTSAKYIMTIGGEEVEKIARSHHNFSITYDVTSEQDTVPVMAYASAPYIFTPTGIKFFEPVEIYGRTMQEFTLDVGADLYNAVGADVQIIMQSLPINQTFATTDTQWYFVDFSPKMQSLLDTAASNIEKAGGDIYMGAFIGWYDTSDYSGMSLVFIFLLEGNYYGAGYKIKATVIDGTDDQVKLAISGRFLNGNYYYNYLRSLLAGLVGTFKLTADDNRNPSSILFEKTTDPNTYFTVEL